MTCYNIANETQGILTKQMTKTLTRNIRDILMQFFKLTPTTEVSTMTSNSRTLNYKTARLDKKRAQKSSFGELHVRYCKSLILKCTLIQAVLRSSYERVKSEFFESKERGSRETRIQCWKEREGKGLESSVQIEVLFSFLLQPFPLSFSCNSL